VDTTGPGGRTDPLARTILLTAAALSGLLSAATTMRDMNRADGETQWAARGVRSAVQALEEATDAARGNRFVADLLEMTD
jgi:hypothetical protein